MRRGWWRVKIVGYYYDRVHLKTDLGCRSVERVKGRCSMRLSRVDGGDAETPSSHAVIVILAADRALYLFGVNCYKCKSCIPEEGTGKLSIHQSSHYVRMRSVRGIIHFHVIPTDYVRSALLSRHSTIMKTGGEQEHNRYVS